nr:FtsW/RodA/SpoVE family cell cycle protein [Pseudonocardia sp.]
MQRYGSFCRGRGEDRHQHGARIDHRDHAISVRTVPAEDHESPDAHGLSTSRICQRASPPHRITDQFRPAESPSTVRSPTTWSSLRRRRPRSCSKDRAASNPLLVKVRGGMVGAWWEKSLRRAKWRYLPHSHNDFIFAMVGEELGFVGGFAVLALFATLAYTGLRVATRNTDPWVKIVAGTMTMWLVGQAAINIGYVVGLLPVTGIPLPLISSGGTSLVVTMFVFGILANAARHEPEAVAALRRHGQGRLARLLGLRLPEPYPTHRRAPTPGPVR